MSSPKIMESKKETVAEITSKMRSSTAFIIVDYKGVNVDQVTRLRSRARAGGMDYKIYKNTFMRFAAKECGYGELEGYLEGTNAVLFSESDAVAPAKLVTEFARENRMQTLTLKAGVIDGRVTDAEQLSQIAALPPREVLLARVLGSLNAPIAKFVYALNALKEKLEQAS